MKKIKVSTFSKITLSILWTLAILGIINILITPTGGVNILSSIGLSHAPKIVSCVVIAAIALFVTLYRIWEDTKKE